MSGEPETVGEAVASEISDAIDAANARADDRQELADAILDGALQTEQARQVRSLEDDVSECLNNQAALSEAMTGMALQLETVQGALSTLQALLPSIVSPPMDQSGAADGPRESSEEAAEQTTVVIAPEAETVEAPPANSPPEKPARKRSRWI